jgi:hypothetical protein
MAHRLFQRRLGQARQGTGTSERHHVDPAARGLGHLLQRLRHRARAPASEGRGRLALVGVADQQAARAERDLVGEAMEVQPVDGQQEVKAVVQRRQRLRAQPQQCRRLAAPDLRPAGAHEQAIQTGARRRVQQQRAGGHHAGAAAAGQGQREAPGRRCRWRRGKGGGHGGLRCVAVSPVKPRPITKSLI